jgi:hypothetical protein
VVALQNDQVGAPKIAIINHLVTAPNGGSLCDPVAHDNACHGAALAAHSGRRVLCGWQRTVGLSGR